MKIPLIAQASISRRVKHRKVRSILCESMCCAAWTLIYGLNHTACAKLPAAKQRAGLPEWVDLSGCLGGVKPLADEHPCVRHSIFHRAMLEIAVGA
jgi:hypothetical protein